MLPIDTAITSEVGNVEMKLTFTKLEMSSDGSFKEHVRKTDVVNVEILPVAQWSDYVASSDLDNISKIMLESQSQNEQMKAYAEQIQALGQMFMVTKADNIKLDEATGKLQLQSMGAPIGDSVIVGDEDCCEDGIPVVDFSVVEPESPDDEEVDNVVEF